MKIALFAALALVASLSSALGQTRTLTMTGQGEVMAAPDMVTLSAGVTSEASTAAAALSANSTRMQGVFTALKKMDLADRDIQTANFSVAPQNTGGANDQPRRISGYLVNNEVRVKLNDVNKLGTALDALVAAGANQIYGVSFGIKDEAALLDQARAKAVNEAKAKAATYAKAAGVTLGPILSVNENAISTPRPMFEAVTVTASRVAPTAAGEESVAATVSIVWILQ
jgi:uncharacterized protein YggE